MKRYDIFVHANGREKQVSTTFSLEGAKQMMKQYCDDHPDVSLGALTAIGPDGEYDMYDLFDIRDVGDKKILVSSTDIKASTDTESDLYTYYDVYMIGEDDGAIGAFAIEYDIPVDEMIAEQEELCEPYGTLAGFGVAKGEYYDALAEDGEEFVTIVREDDGNLTFGIFVGDSLCPPSLRLLDDADSEYMFDDNFNDYYDENGIDVTAASDVKTYKNRRNENKFIETKKYDDGHTVSRQYMKWDTPNGEVKNYNGAKDAKRGRWSRANKNTLKSQLDEYDEVETSRSIQCSMTNEQIDLARVACNAIWDFQDSCVGDPELSADLTPEDIETLDAAREILYMIVQSSTVI